MRGIHDKLRLVMDAPLDQVYFVNFEATELIADDRTIRRPRTSVVDPTETFTYVPNSEAALYEYNVVVEMELEEEVQVLPYEKYKAELKKSKKPTFYGWTSLLILRLHNCHLDQLDGEVFDGLNNLVELLLDHNHIKVIPAFSFYGIPNLRSLSLSHNEILDLNYRDLAGLLNLRDLDLSYNNLSKLSEMTFPPFPKLELLDLRYNAISHIYAYTFDVMNHTKVLYLGDPEVEIDFVHSENAFNSLSELRELLILNGTHPKFSERIFSGLGNLRALKMKGQFNELTFDSFGSIPNVTDLKMTHCSIVVLSMDTFYNNELLEVIDLSHNNISYLPPNIFDRQFKLRELYLHHNHLTTLSNSFFAKTMAKAIRLTDNPWICTCEMLRTWKQGVTNVRIKRKKETFCHQSYNDVITSDPDMCREKISYHTVFDNKLSPRCDGGPEFVKNRAVYYAYRRDLKCATDEPLQGRLLSKNVKGIGKVAMVLAHANDDAKAMHARKVKIMHMMAKRKNIEKTHFRNTNDINYRNRRPAVFPIIRKPIGAGGEQDDIAFNRVEDL